MVFEEIEPMLGGERASLQLQHQYFSNDQFQQVPIDFGSRGSVIDPALYPPSHLFDMIPAAQISIPCSFSDALAAEIKKQNDEINCYLKVQCEQMRQFLSGRKQIELELLLHYMEKIFAEKLEERDGQIGEIGRRNVALEEGLRMKMQESEFWQIKAKCSETMVTLLWKNLQDAVAAGQEGCGESRVEENAVASFDNVRAIEAREEDGMNNTDNNNKKMKMKKEESLRGHNCCRECGSLDVCILLLPCRHLCLCKKCYPHLHLCPICYSVRSDCVEVYLS